MVGRVAASAVDTFGVVVERAAGVDEHEHRGVPGVCCREFVDVVTALPARSQSAGVLNSPPIIMMSAAPAAGRRRTRRRQVDEFAAVLKPDAAD